MQSEKAILIIYMTIVSLFLSVSSFAGNGWNIVQDGDGYGEGFIVPNEAGYLSYAPHLKNKNGVLISVGTFRAFQAAVMGDFSYIFLLDYAAEVVQFNKQIIDIIKKSSTRSNFLNLLFRSSRVIEKIENGNESLLFHDSNLNQKSNMFKFLKKIIQYYNDETTYGANFLTSDIYFNKLKNLINADKVILINGSLSGKETISELSLLLKERNLEVSVLDVSNAKDYIIWSKQLSFYYRNLMRIPWANDAQVIWSVPAHANIFVGPNIQNNWAYFANPASDYVEFIYRLQNREPDEVSRVYDNLHQQFMPYALPKIYSCNRIFN